LLALGAAGTIGYIMRGNDNAKAANLADVESIGVLYIEDGPDSVGGPVDVENIEDITSMIPVNPKDAGTLAAEAVPADTEPYFAEYDTNKPNPLVKDYLAKGNGLDILVNDITRSAAKVWNTQMVPVPTIERKTYSDGRVETISREYSALDMRVHSPSYIALTIVGETDRIRSENNVTVSNISKRSTVDAYARNYSRIGTSLLESVGVHSPSETDLSNIDTELRKRLGGISMQQYGDLITFIERLNERDKLVLRAKEHMRRQWDRKLAEDNKPIATISPMSRRQLATSGGR
jgi:hypothetical protein